MPHLSFPTPRSIQFQKKCPPLPASPLICAFSRPQPQVAACWFCTCSTPPRPLLHGLCMFHPSQPTLICRSSYYILHSTQLWCFLSISLPPQEARGLCLREASLQARNDAGVAKGPLAAWESKASLLMTKVTGDCGDMLKRARAPNAHTTKHCAHRLRPHHWLAGSVSPKYNRKNNRFRFRLTISFGPCPPRTPQTL